MFKALRLCLVLPGRDRRLDVVAGTTKYSAGFRDLHAKRTQIKQSPRSDNDNAAAFVFHPPFYFSPFPLLSSYYLHATPVPNPFEYFDDSGHWSLAADPDSFSLSRGPPFDKAEAAASRKINCIQQRLPVLPSKIFHFIFATFVLHRAGTGHLTVDLHLSPAKKDVA